MDNLQYDEEKDVFIFDLVGGWNGNITKIAWYVFKYTHHQQELCGYQYKSNGKVFSIVNAVTKAWIKDRDITVVLKITIEL